eukprot:CAMPEP_0204533932 /NCGR_PEP_ID=MMETSP0661-20131031/12579_1 /ASSEMBLY_ACC=CAM_ASM_000606 /TAXON_ID=109239 /ORGANISM="Alexandrium margalefi, Strain AMGDE01CS-322" /LENGTH=327 /DNA_ID=CAMNT_0051540351 /DNA_START=136 /DNA_END=1118 /DNA_ORIENTATION=-
MSGTGKTVQAERRLQPKLRLSKAHSETAALKRARHSRAHVRAQGKAMHARRARRVPALFEFAPSGATEYRVPKDMHAVRCGSQPANQQACMHSGASHQKANSWQLLWTQQTAPGFRPVISSGESARQPIQALIEAVACRRTRRLDEPLAVAQVVQSQLLGDIRCSHRVRQVLLVGKHEDHRVAHLLLVQHLGELLPGVLDAVAVVAVHDEDQPVGALVVVAPERPDLVLAADVPNGEIQILVLNRLDIEADGRDRGNHLAKLKLVKYRRFACGVKPYHQDSHVCLAYKALPDLCEGKAHGCDPARPAIAAADRCTGLRLQLEPEWLE